MIISYIYIFHYINAIVYPKLTLTLYSDTDDLSKRVRLALRYAYMYIQRKNLSFLNFS